MEVYGRSVLVSQSGKYEYELFIILNNGMRVGTLTKDRFFKTVEGVDYYEYTDKKQERYPYCLYCTCGYEGEPNEIHKVYTRYDVDGSLLVDEEAPLKKRYSYYDKNNKLHYVAADRRVKVSPIFACPVCQKEPDISSSYERMKIVLHDYRLTESIDQTKKGFEWEVVRYQVEERNRCNVIKSKHCWEVNLQTGESVIRTEGKGAKEINISLGIESYSLKNEDIRSLGESAEASYLLTEFLRECLLRRGVRHKSLDHIIFGQEKDPDWQQSIYTVHRIMLVMPFIRYPQLETMDCRFWIDMPESIQKKMEHASHSKISVIEALTGHKSKSIRLLVEEEGNLELAVLFGRIVHDPNHLRKLLKGVGGVVKSPFGLWYSQEMVSIIRNLYSSEKEFVNGLLKLNQSISDLSDQGNSFDYHRIDEYLEDTLRIFDKIKEKDASYQLPFQGDLKKLHDDLARYYRRLKHENKVIPYTKEEKNLYHRTVDDYQFVLAKDTHELIEAGEEMDICVGSYREEALSGKSVIVFAFNKQGERRLCMELTLKGIMMMTQAKRHGNRLPDAEEAAIVKKWAVLCRVDTQLTDDLKACSSTYSEG